MATRTRAAAFGRTLCLPQEGPIIPRTSAKQIHTPLGHGFVLAEKEGFEPSRRF